MWDSKMARDPHSALVALNRFGFGARGGASGDFAGAASDPRGFIKAELNKPDVALLESAGLLTSPALAQLLFAYREEVRQQRLAAEKAAPVDALAEAPATVRRLSQAEPVKPQDQKQDQKPDQKAQQALGTSGAGEMSSTNVVPPGLPGAPPPKPAPQPLNIIQKTYRAEALVRFQRATLAEAGFVERLVAFWSNHFCISASKGEPARIWAGAFEREAIRPHVLGRFADMLLAVEQHPAMLFFLDNQQSLGPNSRAGRNRKLGLNENLAREIMELHTLGVGSGYTQDDVTSLARIITGWTYAGPNGRVAPPGSFLFNANAHEPGPQTLLGKNYPDTGLSQGQSALNDIAQNPATAKFIATKLVRHFIADDPPPALVARLADKFRATDGDLRAVALALIDADDAWSAPLTKIRSPYECVIATGRLLARIPEDPGRYLNSLNLLGQPLWTPAGPNGFADTNAAWAAPEGLKLRLDISTQVAARIGDAAEPRQLIDVVAGDATSTETRQAIERAESRQQAMALLLMSPEFQRR
jgi:uncharacterized protein (DUF1800 family)